jgi:hypothetical protein
MGYAKRHFYAIGCRHRDRQQHDRSYIYLRDHHWPRWAFEAYLAGYYCYDPNP